ncbi:unnamed protein product [Larinioides sclopetarius]|uniref:Uncharacterized protein n=1 Tax=Larinioides sclopetarius TaxID=280406 RepID=A0AAV2BZ38_9ARAC
MTLYSVMFFVYTQGAENLKSCRIGNNFLFYVFNFKNLIIIVYKHFYKHAYFKLSDKLNLFLMS